jgi:hypothetical protein
MFTFHPVDCGTTIERAHGRRGRMPAPSFSIGPIECRVVSDGMVSYPPNEVFTGVPPDELDRALADRLDEDGNVPIASNCLLISTRGRRPTAAIAG